jgi:hypothetical protein
MFLYAFGLLLFLHGAIHLIGFAKGFNLRIIPLLTQDISRTQGICWFFTAILFFIAGGSFFCQFSIWRLLMLLALVSSQVLIVLNWENAKPGSFINLLILVCFILMLLLQ